MSRQRSSSRRSMLAKPTAISWWESHNGSLHQTQSGSGSGSLQMQFVSEQIEQRQIPPVHTF
ncbi:hypothetical protein, partial [Arthrobacter sp. TMS2-4]